MLSRRLRYSVIAALLVSANPAWTQSSASDPASLDVRAQLAAVIDAFETDIAILTELAAWQSDMLRAARVDPEAALRQRRPVGTCLNTVLAPICAQLPALFQADPRALQQHTTPNGAGGPESEGGFE